MTSTSVLANFEAAFPAKPRVQTLVDEIGEELQAPRPTVNNLPALFALSARRGRPYGGRTRVKIAGRIRLWRAYDE